MNWQALFADKSAQTTAANVPANPDQASTKPADWALNLHDIQLQHWRLSLEDQSFLHPLQLQVADVNSALSLNLQQGHVAVSQLQTQLADIRLISSLQAAPVAPLGRLIWRCAD